MNAVWLYVRRADDAERRRQLDMLQRLAQACRFEVSGFSADKSDGPLLLRPGLQQAMRRIREEEVDILLVSSLSNISDDNRLLLTLLKTMQAHRVKLRTTRAQLLYELHGRGLEDILRRRAARFNGFLPY